MIIDWQYVFTLLLDADFWWASLNVVTLSVLTWGAGLILGLCLALAKESSTLPVRKAAEVYVWFFRSLPLLVLLIFVYNLPQLVPQLGGALSNPFAAGLIAMVASETAYMAEIYRGGLLGVPKGQQEAGRALPGKTQANCHPAGVSDCAAKLVERIYNDRQVDLIGFSHLPE